MKIYFGIFIILFCGCNDQEKEFTYFSDTLQIKKVTEGVYLHISFLNSEKLNNIECNGLVIIHENEGIVVDTPTDDHTSKELMDWMTNEFECEIIHVIVTHFHKDCLGGLVEFHKKGIPSMANQKTIELAIQNDLPIPSTGFTDSTVIKIGSTNVICKFPGEGHTKDNIVVYYPRKKVLFGGCLVKAIGAGKGNLEDANEEEWSNSVSRLKKDFKEVKVVIPGHGDPGGKNLLDYTIRKFEKD